MIDIQYYTFWWQNVSSSIIYVLALMSIGTLVNLNPSWAYDPNVILGNEDFNVYFVGCQVEKNKFANYHTAERDNTFL